MYVYLCFCVSVRMVHGVCMYVLYTYKYDTRMFI